LTFPPPPSEHILWEAPPSPAQATLVCRAENTAQCIEKGLNHLLEGAHTHARIAFETACEADIAEGCGEAGKLLAQGFGGDVDSAGALDRYIRGCSGGHRSSCTHAGRLASSDHLGSPDPVASLAFYRQACPGGGEVLRDLRGCELLGLSLLRGEAKVVDFSKAKEALEHECTGEIADGCHHLGTLYRDGLGVSKNPTKALEYHEHACQAGSVEACATAGVIYHRGLGIPLNSERSRPLLEKGCNGGNKVACQELNALKESTP
jgi:TPR repeat protein